MEILGVVAPAAATAAIIWILSGWDNPLLVRLLGLTSLADDTLAVCIFHGPAELLAKND